MKRIVKGYNLKVTCVILGILFLFSSIFYTLSFSYENTLRVPLADGGRLARIMLNQLGMRYLGAPANYNHFTEIQAPDFLDCRTLEGLSHTPKLRKIEEGFILIEDDWGAYRVLQAPFATLKNYLILEKGCATCSALLFYARKDSDYIFGSIHILPDGPGRYGEVTSYYRDVKDWVNKQTHRGFTDIRVLFLNPKGLSKPRPFASDDIHYTIEHMIYDLGVNPDITFITLPLHILSSGQVVSGNASPVYTNIMSNINGVFIVTVEFKKVTSGVVATPVPRVLL